MSTLKNQIGDVAASLPNRMASASILLVIVSAVMALAYVFNNRYISKLRSFPGPFWATISPFWLTRQCRLTRRSEQVMKQHRKYGDFIRIAPNSISINNPEAVFQIYGHKNGFVKGDFYEAFMQVRPVVFNARNVDVHSRKRRYLNPAFSARALVEFEPIMDGDMRAWTRQLCKMVENQKSRQVDFTVWTNYLAFDVIGNFAFGKPFGFVEAGKDAFNLISTIDTRGEVLNALGTVPKSIRRFMRYNYLDNFWSSGLRATANLEKIGRAAYAGRKESQDSREDLLSYLFSAKDPDTKKPLPEEEIVAEAISFIVGGSDTTSSTMTNFIDIVARDSDLQNRIQKELDEAFPGQPLHDWVASDKIAGSLPLLNATLREVMRLRPTLATGLERIVPAGGASIAGRYFPGGTVVSVPTCGPLRDERIFKNPEQFDPDRWLGSDSVKIIEHFLPFSYGPRACIGRNFAWMEVVKSMAMLFKLFDVRRSTEAPTIIREGFFNKAAECHCTIRLRQL